MMVSTRERERERKEKVIDFTSQGLEEKINSRKKLPREYSRPRYVYVDPDNNRIEYDPDNIPDYVVNNARIGDDNNNTDTSNIDTDDFVMKPSDRVEPFIGVANENRSKGQAYPEPYQTPDPEPNEIRLLEASGATNVTETLYSSVTGKTTVIRGSLSSNTETY